MITPFRFSRSLSLSLSLRSFPVFTPSVSLSRPISPFVSCVCFLRPFLVFTHSVSFLEFTHSPFRFRVCVHSLCSVSRVGSSIRLSHLTPFFRFSSSIVLRSVSAFTLCVPFLTLDHRFDYIVRSPQFVSRVHSPFCFCVHSLRSVSRVGSSIRLLHSLLVFDLFVPFFTVTLLVLFIAFDLVPRFVSLSFTLLVSFLSRSLPSFRFSRVHSPRFGSHVHSL